MCHNYRYQIEASQVHFRNKKIRISENFVTKSILFQLLLLKFWQVEKKWKKLELVTNLFATLFNFSSFYAIISTKLHLQSAIKWIKCSNVANNNLKTCCA